MEGSAGRLHAVPARTMAILTQVELARVDTYPYPFPATAPWPRARKPANVNVTGPVNGVGERCSRTIGSSGWLFSFTGAFTFTFTGARTGTG